MSITQFIVKLTSFVYCGSIYLFLGTYLDFFEKISKDLNEMLYKNLSAEEADILEELLRKII